MKLIVGLGNPGQKYKNNRHNVGHMLVDYLVSKLKVTSHELADFNFVKTDCYMNQSGIFAKKQVNRMSLPSSELYIAHDDLDIPFGSFKIQFGRGPKVHNGITSVEEALETDEFWRIRIGVDGRPAMAGRISGEEYVLSDFTPDELAGLPELFSRVADRLRTVYNTKDL